MKKKILSIVLVVLLVGTFCLFALGSGESSTNDQGTASADPAAAESNTTLGDYDLEIKSCRLAKDYEGKDIVIVKYGFTNNSEKAASFMFTFDDAVYQNGIGLEKSFFVADSANYNSDDMDREIKTGATLDVEVAYELNDTTTDIEVEVKELISFDDDMVKKTFTIAK